MTNLPPPDRRSSPRSPLGFDEFIGILVAFGTIGAILFWSLARRNDNFNLIRSLAPSPTPTAQSTPPPSPQTEGSTSVLPLPTEIPTRQPYDSSILEPTPVLVPGQAPSSQATKFADVPDDFWARPFIEGLAAWGIVMSKDNSFRPNEPITRAEFAAWLQEAFESTSGQPTQKFKDIAANFWATSEIDQATRSGFLKGYPGEVFRPEQPIPKVQVLVALASGLNLTPPSAPTQVLQSYNDAAQIPNYATEKVAAATTTNLVVNHPELKSLNPNQNATRAEVAAMIYQALVQTGKAQPIQSPYIVQSR